MNDNFLLYSELARRLYGEVRGLPVIDYHNHIPLTDLRDGRRYENLTDLWISADPYKHRLMRICGVPEEKITGGASDYEKFRAWSHIFPSLMGTPVYDWSLMELWRVFSIELFPSDDTADEIWSNANEQLKTLTIHTLLERFNVAYMSPVASVLDDVSWYESQPQYAPSLRGDDAASPNADFAAKLAASSGLATGTFDEYLAALDSRLDAFVQAGCRFADHALDDGFAYLHEDGRNDARYANLLAGKQLDEHDQAALSCAVLRHLGREYGRRGLTMQLHMGATRRTSSRLRELVGAAGGYAAIGSVDVSGIVKLLDDIEQSGELPRTMLFTLNPAYNEALSILSGSFSKDGEPAIVSQGPAWWWCDHKEGIRQVFDSLSAYSVLSTFIGMTTDSRSVLSFVRHDYFRRILCGWLADKVERGEFPDRPDDLASIARKVCYENARNII
ncbi:MAG: glucuronate isomerase [Clostridia bacterium]|nr:glucuronate isomerase [Clostridia bacterium]